MVILGDMGPAVDRLAELARGGRALEFAIGTGRAAVPLAARRHADWKGSEFTAESRSCVSVYGVSGNP